MVEQVFGKRDRRTHEGTLARQAHQAKFPYPFSALPPQARCDGDSSLLGSLFVCSHFRHHILFLAHSTVHYMRSMGQLVSFVAPGLEG